MERIKKYDINIKDCSKDFNKFFKKLNKTNQSNAFLFTGGLYVAIPGQVKGFWAAHQKYGRLPWRDLFKPTIELCKVGVKIDWKMYLALRQIFNEIQNETTLSETFINPKTNKLYQVN